MYQILSKFKLQMSIKNIMLLFTFYIVECLCEKFMQILVLKLQYFCKPSFFFIDIYSIKDKTKKNLKGQMSI